MFNFYEMKKIFLMALLALLSCTAIISCTKDEDKKSNNSEINGGGSGTNVGSNPFAGNTYKAVGEGRDENDYFEFKQTKVFWGPDNEFNYTFDETTFTLSRGTTDVAVVSYTFSEDKNTLTLSSSAGISGTYAKQQV